MFTTLAPLLNSRLEGETMSGHEDERFRLRNALAEHIGDELAARLMEALPPYNWSDIVTNKDLALHKAEIRAEFSQVHSSIAALRTEVHSLMRTQLIQLTTIFGIINASMVAVLQFGR
jgi:hypothetical protein